VAGVTQLDVLARRQYGCLHHRQILSVISRHALNRRLERAIYLSVQPNVVRLASCDSSATARAWAAVLSVGHPAAVAGVSEAVLHDFPDASDSRDVALVVPHSRRAPHRPGLTVRRVRDWAERSWTTRAGLTVASLADTVIDLAAVLPPGRTQAMVEQLLWRRPDAARPHASVGLWTSRVSGHPARSEGTLRRPPQHRRAPSRDRTAAARGAALRHNVLLGDGRGPVAEVDFLWRALRVAVQIDGWRYHAHGTFQHDHDVFTARVVERDFVVLRFTGRDVEHRLDWVLDRIQAVLHRQAGRLPASVVSRSAAAG